MSKKPSKTLGELYQELNHSQIVEDAEDKFRKRQVSKRRFSQRIINLIPIATIAAWFVAYILSAPHTAALFIRITPAPIIAMFPLASLAPVVIEGFIFIVAALNHASKAKTGEAQYRLAVYGMFGLSVAVNIIGGLVSLYEYFVLSGTNNPFEVAWYVISFPAGILISYLSIVSGEILVKFATGEIDLEIDPSAAWRGKAKYYALIDAFYNAAITHGTTGARANRYAVSQAASYCRDEIKVLQNGSIVEIEKLTNNQAVPVSQPVLAVQSVPKSPEFQTSQQMIVHNLGSESASPEMDKRTVPIQGNLTQDKVIEWIETHSDVYQSVLSQHTGQRTRAKYLSTLMIGHDGGYKTIERAIKKMEAKNE